MMNPKLEPGDKIILYHMDGEVNLPPGTVGIVDRVIKDPFDGNEQIIYINWENGSTLSLLSGQDSWKKFKKDIIDESAEHLIDPKIDPHGSWIERNINVRRAFNIEYLMEYLMLLKESGIVNMWGSSPFLYSGPEHIERYYGEGREDDETFQKLLEESDKAKNVFIAGLLKWMELENLDIDDMDKVNRYADRISKSLLQYYILFHP
jgi:hypothetical protein